MEEERRVVCRPTVLGLFSKVAGMEDGEILNTQCYHYAIISTIIEIMRQLFNNSSLGRGRLFQR